MEPYLGEIRVFAQPTPPKGWLPCDGRTLQINANNALYSLLGTLYGGNGTTTFNLPNLQGRAMLSQGRNAAGKQYVMMANNNTGGSEGVVLTPTSVPPHAHTMVVVKSPANVTLPGNMLSNAPAVNTITNESIYMFNPAATNPTLLNPTALAMAGSSAAHENRMPFLPLTVCIATVGLYPPRN